MVEDNLILMVSSNNSGGSSSKQLNKVPLALHLVQLLRANNSGVDKPPEHNHQDKVDSHHSNKLVLLHSNKLDSGQLQDHKADSHHSNNKLDSHYSNKLDSGQPQDNKVDSHHSNKLDLGQLQDNKVDLHHSNNKLDSHKVDSGQLQDNKVDSHHSNSSKVALVLSHSSKALPPLNKLKVDFHKVDSLVSSNHNKVVLELRRLHPVLVAFHSINKVEHLVDKKHNLPRLISHNGTLRLLKLELLITLLLPPLLPVGALV